MDSVDDEVVVAWASLALMLVDGVIVVASAEEVALWVT